MKRIISIFLAVFMTLAVSMTAFAAEPERSETITELPGSVEIPVTIIADLTPGYKALVEDGKVTLDGPGFKAVDENPPKDAYRLVVVPIDDEEALKWFSGCAKSPWQSTGTIYAVFYEDAKGNKIPATNAKVTVEIPDGFKNLQVYSLDSDGKGQLVDRFDTLGTSVTFTTNGKLYYGVIHRQGIVEEQTSVGKDAPDTTLNMTPEELADAVLSDEEKGYLKDGIDVHIKLTVEDITNSVSAADKQAITSAAVGYTVGEYIDIELLKQIGDRPWENIHQTKKPVRITVNIPKRLLGVKGRVFAMARVHNGKGELLKDLDNNPNTITIETNEFSTYAILYRDGVSGGEPPRTGVENHLNFWLTILGLSVIAFVPAFFPTKRKKDEE